MPFATYMVACRDGSIYTGHTEKLEIRFDQHNSGYFPTCYTVSRRPVTLLWSETFQTRIEALEAERQIKGWTKAKKLAFAAGSWALLAQLARCRTAGPVAGPSTGSGPTEPLARGAVAIVSDPARPELVEGPTAWPRTRCRTAGPVAGPSTGSGRTEPVVRGAVAIVPDPAGPEPVEGPTAWPRTRCRKAGPVAGPSTGSGRTEPVVRGAVAIVSVEGPTA